MIRNTSIEQIFDKCLLSFRTGFMKPDGETFVHAANELGLPPHEIAFFDDNPQMWPRRPSFNAFRVNGFCELKRKLEELDIM